MNGQGDVSPFTEQGGSRDSVTHLHTVTLNNSILAMNSNPPRNRVREEQGLLKTGNRKSTSGICMDIT